MSSVAVAKESPRASAAAGVPILMYHEVALEEELQALDGKLQSSYIVTTEQFARHLQLIRNCGCHVVGLDQLSAWLDGRAQLPERPVVISFDDGYLGNYRHALPILKNAGMAATFFVATRKIGDPFMMDWQQLREMSRSGMLIESHTASHPLLSTLDESETRRELMESRQAIEEHTGQEVKYISLPNGDANKWYRHIAAESGYVAGCGSEIGCNKLGADPFLLKRVAVKRGISDAQLQGYLLGAPAVMIPARVRAMAKRALVGVMTKRIYDRLYNRLFGVEDQRKSRT